MTISILVCQKSAEKFLDTASLFYYIHTMFTSATVILPAIRKTAWQHIAMAEGGFY